MILNSCETETRPVTAEMKVQALDAISRNEMPSYEGWDLQETENGVRFVELSPGTGPEAWFDDDVKVHYVLWRTDGTLVEESRPDGIGFEFGFTVGERWGIKGWSEIVLQMNTGSEVLAVVPWRLAYGRRGNKDIPGRSDLVFYIKLLRVSS